MKELLKKALAHIKETLSEDGIGSYSRMIGATVVLVALAWVTYIVIKTHALPELDGVAYLIGGGNTPYFVNQAKKIAGAIKGATDKPEVPVEPAA